jgi:hypothetical protein
MSATQTLVEIRIVYSIMKDILNLLYNLNNKWGYHFEFGSLTYTNYPSNNSYTLSYYDNWKFVPLFEIRRTKRSYV